MTPTTAASLDLARRALAAPGWRWKRGMSALILYRDHPCAPVTDDRMEHLLSSDDIGLHEYRWMNIPDHDALPDLGDPATQGCLLTLAREVWSAPRAYLMPTIDGGWRVCGLPEQVSDDAARCYGPTEAAALVAALEAAHG